MKSALPSTFVVYVKSHVALVVCLMLLLGPAAGRSRLHVDATFWCFLRFQICRCTLVLVFMAACESPRTLIPLVCAAESQVYYPDVLTVTCWALFDEISPDCTLLVLLGTMPRTSIKT